MAKKKEKKTELPKKAFQRFINGHKVVVEAISLEEAEKAFKSKTSEKTISEEHNILEKTNG